MSLLIKALASAEKGKQAELKQRGVETAPFAELNLEPLSADDATTIEKTPLNFAAEAPGNKVDALNAAATASVAKAKLESESSKDHQRQAAANVFVANQSVKQPASIAALLMLGVAGAATIWIALQGYQYFSSSNTPPQVVIQPVPQVAAVTPQAAPVMPQAAEPPTPIIAPQTAQAETAVAELPGIPDKGNEPALKSTADDAAALSAPSVFAANQPAAKKSELKKPASKNPEKSTDGTDLALNARAGESKSGEPQPASTLKLLSRTPAAGVDPTLQAAYEAYSRGDDAAAQLQYRQVLQADTRNVDALLGMAAIALRQSRQADANGWYQKVLEIEPRNSTALSAVANLQIHSESAGGAAGDYAATESRIKNMLVQQPEAANLHAALGNLYASQNQWPQAQTAYFNASRYAPNSADYAFNLAVSLDQLGKSGLALAQYQRALNLLNHTGPSSLDKTQLEARIKALQE